MGTQQKAQCEEGKLWSKELELCDFEQNVSCEGRGELRGGRFGLNKSQFSGVWWYLKVILQLGSMFTHLAGFIMDKTVDGNMTIIPRFGIEEGKTFIYFLELLVQYLCLQLQETGQ